MERLNNQSRRHRVRVNSVTSFRVIMKQGGDGEIHIIMCTQGLYIRSASLYNRTAQGVIWSPTPSFLAVCSTHNIKADNITHMRQLITSH
jgi:hypothetical protein